MDEGDGERRRFLMACGIWFLLSGIDYSIVLPTVHHYLRSIEAETSYIGLVISALSLGAMLSAPIYAKITDRVKSARNILRVGILFSIAGNCLYFMKKDKNFVVLARFISGIGWGLEGALMGQIGRIYNTANKTRSFAVVLMMRQLGVVTGPLCILFMEKLAFKWKITENYTLEVTKFSAVGLFLACAWSVVWLLVFILYVDPPPQPNDENNNSIERVKKSSTSESVQIIEGPLVATDKKYRAVSPTGLIHEPIIVAACSTFSTYILQSGMETLITPFTDRYFGWTEMQNAYMYVAVGTTALTGYFSMQFVSTKLDDRQTLLMGCSFCTAVLILILIIFPIATFRAEWIYPLFGLGVFLFCWFLPYVVTSAAAILSKSASPEQQSIVQSVRTTGEVLAQILAPLWVGYMLHSDLVLIFQLIFMTLCLVFTVMSWSVLKPEEVIPYNPTKPSNRDEMGFEEPLMKQKSILIEDHLNSRASLPSSIICSMSSLAKQPT